MDKVIRKPVEVKFWVNEQGELPEWLSTALNQKHFTLIGMTGRDMYLVNNGVMSIVKPKDAVILDGVNPSVITEEEIPLMLDFEPEDNNKKRINK